LTLKGNGFKIDEKSLQGLKTYMADVSVNHNKGINEICILFNKILF
jgi:hypothetical protein